MFNEHSCELDEYDEHDNACRVDEDAGVELVLVVVVVVVDDEPDAIDDRSFEVASRFSSFRLMSVVDVVLVVISLRLSLLLCDDDVDDDDDDELLKLFCVL